MDTAPVLARRYDGEPALDARGLFLAGLDHLRQLAGRTWTDHNLHDPGITLLELLTYALTELSYRAGFPVPDLVAGPQASQQFWRARQVLPCEPLTSNDYRRLLIDLPGVKNAWLQPHTLTAFADLRRRELRLSGSAGPLVRPVAIRGLFDVRIDFMDHINSVPERLATLARVRRTLARHRNLGQDFVDVTEVPSTEVAVCAEVELAREVDAATVGAAIVQAWADTLAPAVPNRSLAEMQALGLEAPAIFDGPALDCGFISDADLQLSELRSEVRLSDVIAATMRVPGVAAVRDLVANALDRDGNALPRPEAWRVPLPAGTRARLSESAGRLVLQRNGVPVLAWRLDAPPPRVAEALAALREAARQKVETERREDLPVPAGRERDLARYTSVQHHMPPLYGLADAPLPDSASPLRQAQALQLGGYLLLFDQWMANLCAQLAQARDALSVVPAHLQALKEAFEETPPEARHELRHQQAQRVRSLPQAVQDKLYRNPALTDAELAAALESRAEAAARWQANLDHLLARVGEDLADYLDLMRSAFGASDAQAIGDRCRFLEEAPALARERGLAHDASTPPAGLWSSAQVSGLERRIARLLGIQNATRRNLSAPPPDAPPAADANECEGLYCIEGLALRLLDNDDRALICSDPGCSDCADDDPFSYRLHIVLPAFSGRFRDAGFRAFAEQTIREQTPAHLLPRVCWVGPEDMAAVETAYRDWITLPEGSSATQRREATAALRDVLARAKNSYPTRPLFDCTSEEERPYFMLGRSALGTAPP